MTIHFLRYAAIVVVLASLSATASDLQAAESVPAKPEAKPIAPGDVLKDPDGAEFRFAYYPSLNRLRLLVLRPPAPFTKWEAVLSTKGKSDVLARSEGTLPFPKAGVTVQVPPLEAGEYDVAMSLVAADGARREWRRGFERKRFPWENNRLGLDRVVIPPFEPLTVEENPVTVSCVLRRHRIDGTGLWSQVTSQGRELLAGPVRLEIESAGKRHVATGGAIAFGEKAADRVRGSASWTAGDFRGRTEFDFDYDGMTKFALDLEPSAARIDVMELVIPMRTDAAWLMHAVTDLLRFHYAGRIPNGKGYVWEYGGERREVRYTDTGEPDASGRVWDSRHVGRYQLPGPFVPYVWLGGPERGIAWFAENDRDWSLDPQRPTLEIRRQGGTTSLVVHLVTRPVVLSRPRRLVFGLMATPAKPMPQTPVSFRRWWTGPPSAKVQDTVGLGFMGACYYWGAAGPCYAFSPAFGNFGIYDEFARLRKGGAFSKEFVEGWLKQFSAAQFEPLRETYRAHVNWSERFLAGGRWNPPPGSRRFAFVNPYTNARAVNYGEEVRTFLDEWSTIDVADPRWPCEERFIRGKDGGYRLAAYGKVVEPGETSGIAYAIDPVPSWQDMVLHYHKRMLESFADGIYFDDYFLSANYSPLGPGYVDDEGNLRPGVNLFAFHDLTKRVAVMQHQMGRRPMIFLHMTNANIVPMLSFGTLLLDHEWRDQGEFAKRDFCERLYLDEDASLLLAQSAGFQSGCLGIVHNLFHGDARINRSALGVALTHEMRMGADGGPPGEAIGEALCAFGYGLPDCRVWRYWDDAAPVKTSGAAVKTLTLARGGEALLVVASYGPAGDVILELDRKTLGLPDDAVATDLEGKKALERLGPGRFKLSIPRHDFRVVRVSAGGSNAMSAKKNADEEEVDVTVELCRYVESMLSPKGVDHRTYVQDILRGEYSEPDVTKEIGRDFVQGFVFKVVSPKEHAGKLLTIHHDGVLATGDPTRFAVKGQRYQTRFPAELLDNCAFRPCSCGFPMKRIEEKKAAEGEKK
jgi:hypothetical protein